MDVRNTLRNILRNKLSKKNMPTRKFEERNIRKLTKAGRASLSLTLPIEIIRELKWKEKQKVAVKRIKGGVEIKDWKK